MRQTKVMCLTSAAWVFAILACQLADPHGMAVWAQETRATGQVGPNEGEQAPHTGPTANASETQPLQADVKYLQNGHGEPVAVPANATLEEYLDWVRNRNAKTAAGPPDYSVTELSLAGTADEDRARLDASITIQVNREDQWVQVPLRLDEAVLRETHYEGSGSASFSGKIPEAGYQWWLKGKGLHRLRLELTVPIRRQPPERRLQIAVPETAVSYLKLDVPIRRLSAKGSEESSLTITSGTDGGSRIEMRGLGKRLNLSWTALPDEQPGKNSLEAKTRIHLEFTGETSLWTVHQEIRAVEGVFDEVAVRLPKESELIGLELAGIEGKYVEKSDPDAGKLVTVSLDQPTAGPIELRWDAVSRFPATGEPFVVEGFDVIGARHQRGDIEISAAEAFKISTRKQEVQSVYRKKVSSTPSVVPAERVKSAYQFFMQPFRLVLDVEEVEPYFSAEPHLFILLSKDRITLEATLRVEVSRPPVRTLDLEWPGWSREGWVIEPAESSDLVERVEAPADDASGRISIKLAKPQSSAFSVRLRASRPLIQMDSRFLFSLPVPSAPIRRPSILVVAYADNVEASVFAVEDTVLRPLPAAVRPTLEIPATFSGLRRDEFRIDTRSHALSAALTVHKQEIRATTSVDVRLADHRISVSQKIAYDVLYERLSEVRLLVPDKLRDRVAFFSEADERYPATWTGLDAESPREVRLTLDEPRLGVIEIHARFELGPIDQLLSEEPAAIIVPIIRSSDAEYRETKVEVASGPDYLVSLPEGQWLEQWTTYDKPLWTASSPQSDIPLTFRQSRKLWSKHVAVPRALLQTGFDRRGNSDFRAHIRVVGLISTFDVNLPKTAVQPEFWWNNSRLGAERVAVGSPNTGRYVLTLSEAPTETDGSLRIAYHSEAPSPFGLSTVQQLAAPEFPSNVWVGETAWEVIFPYEQYLFSIPPDYIPRFRWRWNHFYFSRTPEADYAEMKTWIASAEKPKDLSDLPEGNVYTFSRIGPPTTLQVRSMSQPMIVLAGAGLALAIGFVLLKIPSARNVLTMLVIAFAVAVAGLWYTPQLQLLVQPALLGLLLAVTAALIDDLVSRRRTTTVVTLSSPSEFMVTPSTSSLQQSPAGIGSEAPTSLRTPQTAPGSSQTLSTSDSGRRP